MPDLDSPQNFASGDILTILFEKFTSYGLADTDYQIACWALVNLFLAIPACWP
jgi:hypothetical protein